MAAFNLIHFMFFCPSCNHDSLIIAQCHVASSFDKKNNDRFCMNEYQLGEKMRWWEKSDTRWSNWINENETLKIEENIVKECCYAQCSNSHDLYAIIVFKDLTPVDIIEIGFEKNWPNDFLK